MNPYETKDKQLAGIINHIKTKYVALSFPFVGLIYHETHIHVGTALISRLKKIIISIGRMGCLSSSIWMEMRGYVGSHFPWPFIQAHLFVYFTFLIKRSCFLPQSGLLSEREYIPLAI